MYQVSFDISVEWVGDGAGPMSVPSAQRLKLKGTPVQVPGGDSPSGANLNTAGTLIGTACQGLLVANIAQIQGFASGGD
jgi:hypothetical protein